MFRANNRTFTRKTTVESVEVSKNAATFIYNFHFFRYFLPKRISNGNKTNKAIWIDGGIHAREWISPASVTYFVNDLVGNWKNQSEFMQSIDWYVLPVLNPDGYEYSHTNDRLWRKNRNPLAGDECAGVDLNRNFGYEWGGIESIDDPCDETYISNSAAPTSFDSKQSTNSFKLNNNSETQVRYDGSQLWAVDISENQAKDIILELQKNLG